MIRLLESQDRVREEGFDFISIGDLASLFKNFLKKK